jgi:hypothetical protein
MAFVQVDIRISLFDGHRGGLSLPFKFRPYKLSEFSHYRPTTGSDISYLRIFNERTRINACFSFGLKNETFFMSEVPVFLACYVGEYRLYQPWSSLYG